MTASARWSKTSTPSCGAWRIATSAASRRRACRPPSSSTRPTCACSRTRSPRWQNRTHFLAIAAISMRRLLVERARARGAPKRGGDQVQVTLDDVAAGRPGAGRRLVDRSRRARSRARRPSPRSTPHQARIVELRFFGGLSVEETAEALAISPATVKRHWTIAKAWLLRELAANELAVTRRRLDASQRAVPSGPGTAARPARRVSRAGVRRRRAAAPRGRVAP